MKNKKKTHKIFQSIIFSALIVFSFVLVFFIKMLNNVEATGYYIWNPETNNYVKQLVIRADTLDDTNPTNYICLVDGEYFQFNFEEGKYEFLNTVNVKEIPSKEEPIVDTLIVIKSEFFSVENFKKTVKDPQFWLLTTAVTGCMMISYWAVYTIRRDNRIDSAEYEERSLVYLDRVRLKPLNFSEYIKQNNLAEKKRIYVEKTTAKLTKVQSKYDMLPLEKLDTPKAKKLKEEIAKLKNVLTDEYIDSHILGLKVKYEPLHVDSYRSSDININISARKDKSSEKKIMSAIYVKKAVSSILMSAAFTSVVFACYINFALSGEFWLILIAALWGTGCNVGFAWMQADKIYKNEYLGLLNNKIAVIEDSIKWAATHKSDEKSFDEILELYTKTKVEEKVAEEAKKIKADSEKKVAVLEEKFNQLKQKTN